VEASPTGGTVFIADVTDRLKNCITKGMKNLITLINLCIIFGVTTIVARLDKISEELTDPVSEATTTVSAPSRNITKTKKSEATKSNFTVLATMEPVDQSVADFIKEMTQARMLDLEGGKIAAQRCTSKNLKQYGSLMEDDQGKMLDELRKLAALKKVSLDKSLSPARSEQLQNLMNLHGKSFDKKFVKMMTNDHKRDARIFREATRYQDADIQVFATKYLPVIESHLEKITTIKKN
jgi:putative membrane protein